MKSYLNAMRNYATFSGRTSRRGFWLFYLVLFLILSMCMFLDISIDNTLLYSDTMGPFTAIAHVVHLIPQLAIGSRRLHDSNKCAWWLLTAIVPPVYIIFMLLPPTADRNRFGAPAPSKAPTQMRDSTPIDKIEQLNALRNAGALTDEEFTNIKNSLIKL